MLKIMALFSLMFVVSVFAGCDSCGSECASACGTRRFRACCFNYLRKKRGPEHLKVHNYVQDGKESQSSRVKLPVLIVEDIPSTDEWVSNILSNENHPYTIEDLIADRVY